MKSIANVPEGRLQFSIRVIPRSSRNEIVGWVSTGELKVRVTAPPVEKAANRELIRYMSEVLGIKKGDITITAGARSRVKRLEVPEACKKRLLSFDNI